MTSAWIAFVKKYATEHKISYREALKKAGSTYSAHSGLRPQGSYKTKK